VAGSRGAAARRRQAGEPATPASDLNALVCVLGRALELERVALLAEDDTGARFVPLASTGGLRLRAVARTETPPDGPWSLVLPVTVGTRAIGLLLLARAGGTPLPPADRTLAEGFAAATADVLEHAHLRADLDRAHGLLARADRLSALGMLAAGIAHEIRNPLVSVRAFIQLLPERLHDEEFRTGFRLLALDEIERICALITDLLAFARPARTEREPADVGELIAQVVRLLDAEARRSGVSLLYEGAPDLLTALVDEGQIKQVLLNIVLNAIQACAPRGTVEIEAGAETIAGARWCLVTVADTGPGIAAEHHRHIFEPFFTTKEGGSGLGLFLAHRIVTAHGGSIAAVPREPRGSVFSLRLPAQPVVAQVADAR